MFSVCENGHWRPATADDLQNDCGTTHETPDDYYKEPARLKRKRELTQGAAYCCSQPQHDALERLLWSQVNRHGVHG